MNRTLPRALPISLLLLSASGALYPCGGPESYPITAPLVKPRAYLEALLATDYATGQRRQEIRFLYPFKLTKPKELAQLWSLAYNDYPYSAPDSQAAIRYRVTDTVALHQALANGDLTGAEREARAIVTRVLDMPAIQADSNQAAFRCALELLDLRGQLAGVSAGRLVAVYDSLSAPTRSLARGDMERYAGEHPADSRAPSLRFVALQEAMKREIPNGWPDEIRKAMPAAGWQRLEELHQAWLHDFPQHPLADLVALSRLRLYYFEGRTGTAWQVILAMYPRHLPRLLAEMRFLITNGSGSDVLDSLVGRGDLDPVLRTALLGEIAPGTLTSHDWARLWQLSVTHLQEPWAINLQERLLQKVVEQPDSQPFPEGFPARADNPSQLWGYLRLLALTRAGHIAQALEQGRSLRPDDEVAAVLAKLYLGRREWTQAVSVPGLEPHARRYLIWVMAPDSALSRVAASPDSAGLDARRIRATRLARREGWAAGARVFDEHEPEAAELWRRGATLAADTSIGGRLTYGRFLRDEAPRLYVGKDIVWYRSLSYRLDALSSSQYREFDVGLPWRPEEESQAIRRHLLETSAEFDALRVFAGYLDRAQSSSAGFGGVVQEADRLYNGILNWGKGNSKFWSDYLPQSPEAASIRRAGKRVHAP